MEKPAWDRAIVAVRSKVKFTLMAECVVSKGIRVTGGGARDSNGVYVAVSAFCSLLAGKESAGAGFVRNVGIVISICEPPCVAPSLNIVDVLL